MKKGLYSFLWQRWNEGVNRISSLATLLECIEGLPRRGDEALRRSVAPFALSCIAELRLRVPDGIFAADCLIQI